jgi:hypothetical protein
MFWISHAMNELTASCPRIEREVERRGVGRYGVERDRRAARYCAAVASVARTL